MDRLAGPARATVTLPRPDHVVVVMFENTTYGDAIGKLDPVTGAPYLNSLRVIAANMTRSTGISHPTDPNYLALFSGSTQGISGNSDPRYPSGVNPKTPNLAAQLIANGFTFGDYQQDLGDTVDEMIAYIGQTYPYLTGPNGSYFVDEKRGRLLDRHRPQSSQVPKSVLHDLKNLPEDFSQLPTVSLWHAVEDHDGHQGYPNEKGNDPDNWMKKYLSPYIEWAMTHNSLLIITWDESYTAAEDPALNNHIPTLFIGPMVVEQRGSQLLRLQPDGQGGLRQRRDRVLRSRSDRRVSAWQPHDRPRRVPRLRQQHQRAGRHPDQRRQARPGRGALRRRQVRASGQLPQLEPTGALNDWAVSLGNLDSVYAGSFSVSLWVRTTSTADAAIIGNKDWNSGANVGWLVSTYPSAKTFSWNTQGGHRRDVGLDPPIYDDLAPRHLDGQSRPEPGDVLHRATRTA